MDELSHDIEKYKRGELSSLQMHELEKRALQDPFLADALEGTEQITSDDFSTDINELNSRVQIKADQKLVASMSAVSAKTVASPNKFSWPLRIAASVFLMVGIFWLAMQLMPSSPTQNMAMRNEKSKPTISAQEKEAINNGSETKQELSNLKKAELENILPKQSSVSDRASSGAKSIEPESVLPTPALQPTEEPMALLDVVKSKEQATVDKEAEVAMDEKAAELTKVELKKLSEPIATSSMAARKKSFSIANQVIKGRVLSEEDGTPLTGVNVVVQGTTIGTVTDEEGNYQLPSEGIEKNLIFSFIGFQSKTLPVANQQMIDVKLAPDVSQLSEVVVVGYGGTAKEDAHREPIVKRAEPQGGIRAYDRYLDDNVRYPTEAFAKNIKGKVQIRFTVKTNGQLEDFQVVKSLGSGCDEEVVRLVKEGPTWSPTLEDNVAVESEVLVKVKFDPAKAKR